MRFPPRLGHLATRPVLVAKLTPSYAAAHQLDEEEARDRLDRALSGALREELLAATWTALRGTTRRLDDEALLEKVASSLRDRPQRPGRQAGEGPSFSAFLLVLDVAAGTAGDAVRRVLETPAGQEKARAGLAEGGRFLAAELTRSP